MGPAGVGGSRGGGAPPRTQPSRDHRQGPCAAKPAARNPCAHSSWTRSRSTHTETGFGTRIGDASPPSRPMAPSMADVGDKTAGVVLAGGRSSRMGSSKAALEWHGSTLLRRTVSVVGRAVDGPVVVVGAPGQRLPALPTGVEVLIDPREGLGPLQGIAVGLAAVADRAHAAFVSSTDLPFLHPAFVQAVLGALTSATDVALAGRARLPAAPRRCLSHRTGADGRRSGVRGAAAPGIPVPGVSRPAARRGRPVGRPRGRGARPRARLPRQRQRGRGTTRRPGVGCHRRSRCAVPVRWPVLRAPDPAWCAPRR